MSPLFQCEPELMRRSILKKLSTSFNKLSECMTLFTEIDCCIRVTWESIRSAQCRKPSSCNYFMDFTFKKIDSSLLGAWIRRTNCRRFNAKYIPRNIHCVCKDRICISILHRKMGLRKTKNKAIPSPRTPGFHGESNPHPPSWATNGADGQSS